ncbi:hypothetical protein B0H14DRAFT_2628713 [Mycena olivaceomarginata]|nr:hypothetical protein B0H14DRAFT_2628713 [Mycena olivaceomarginata]
MTPALGVVQIRLIPKIFVEKAVQIALGQKDGERVDVFSGLSRMVLDVIGKAGFNYDFDVLEVKGRPSELNEVFTELLHSPQARRYALARPVQAMIPVLRSLV